MSRTFALLMFCAMVGACAPGGDQDDAAVSAATTTTAPTAEQAATQPVSHAADSARAPNELGRVLVLEYHLIGDQEARWERQRDRFRKDLELLHEHGYRPVSVSELVDKKIDLPRGLSPVVFTFDDASPSQFRYLERDGQLEIDPGSAIGIWLDFAKEHPGWRNKAVFCLLSGAEAGRSFFGNKGIEGQKTEWRHRKVKFLADQGFELCNHTVWHAQLSQYPDSVVQEQIARLQMAVDSAVPGYKIRTLALPLGLWPRNRELAYRGSWTDRRTKRTITYSYDAVLEVSGGPNRSPHDPQFDPKSIDRLQVIGNDLEKAIAQLDRTGTRYVSDGDPRVVAKRAVAAGTRAAGAASADSVNQRPPSRNPSR